jgi:F-box protein 11
MSHLHVWFQCIAQAVRANALRALAGLVPFGEALYDVASDALKRISEFHDGPEQSAALEDIAQAHPDQVKVSAALVAREVAADQPPAVQNALVAYLVQVPAILRQSLRRPSDPAGTTVPAGLALRGPEHLLSLLPARLPRFRAGERPAGVGNWELDELLGVGGFAEVWKARHPRLRGIPPVALKFCLDPSASATLRHEAELLDRVMQQTAHPGIVPLRQAYLDADPLCLEYEYVPGGDLAGLARDWHPGGPSPAERSRVLGTLAAIVGHAHRLSPPVVHRDLKPANVLVRRTPDGFDLRVADFGIGAAVARHALDPSAQTTLTRGALLATSLRGSHTPLYASPQQVRGDAPDPRDDVHALGIIWYQLLTGDLRTGRPSGKGWRRWLAEQGLPPGLVDLLEGCVDDDPAERPADASTLAEQIEEVLGNGHVRCATAVSAVEGAHTAETAVAHPGPKSQLTVAAEGPADHRSISEALRAAAPGARVVVRPGVYREGLVLDRRVEVVAEGEVVIESADSDCVVMRADEATVRGLTLRCTAGAEGGKFYAVDVPGGRLLLEDCDVTSDSLACVAIHGGSANPTVRNCRIHGGAQGGVMVWDGARGTVEGCDIFGHAFAGVEIKDGADPLVRDCKVHGGAQSGVYVHAGGRGTLEGCEVFANRLTGVEVRQESEPVVRRCRVYRSREGCGLFLHGGARPMVEDCEVFENPLSGVAICRQAAPVLRGCTVRDGAQSGVYVYDGGSGLLEGCEVFGNSLAGLTLADGADPVVRRCKVHHGGQSGVFVDAGGRGTLEECDVYANALAGVETRHGGDPLVKRCMVRDGLQAGLLVQKGGRGTFEDCLIADNGLAGVEVRQQGRAAVRGCRITRNAHHGVRLHAGGQALVQGCELAGNGRGPWDVAPGCRVRRCDNRP